MDKRRCSKMDLEVLRKERRNHCQYAFLSSYPEEGDEDETYEAYNVNADTFSDDNCGDIGRVNKKYVKRAKMWCCETSLQMINIYVQMTCFVI